MADNKKTKAKVNQMDVESVTPLQMLKLIQLKAQETTRLINLLTDYICEEKEKAENVEATENADKK